jgi:hypothetical protein
MLLGGAAADKQLPEKNGNLTQMPKKPPPNENRASEGGKARNRVADK